MRFCICVRGRAIRKRKRRTWSGGGVERRAATGTASGDGAPATAASAPGCADGTVAANDDEEVRVVEVTAGAKCDVVAKVPALVPP